MKSPSVPPMWKNNALIVGLTAALLLVLTFFVGIKAWNAAEENEFIGREPRGRDTITIEGEGKVTGKPTLAVIDVGLYSESKGVPEAQAQNSRKVNAIIAGLKDLGIADADLQTSNYNISPKFDYRNGSQTVVGYTVSQSVNVKVRDLAKVGVALDKAGELGANQINGVTFTIDDPTEMKQEARKKALEDASKKARELAEALGVSVVRVVTFAESSGSVGVPPYAYRMDAAVGQGGGVSPQVEAGSLDVISHVSVTFEIR